MKKLFLFLLFIPFVYSQTEDIKDTLTYETDKFVITGTRMNQKIIDVPFSVSRISNKEFKFEKNTSVDEVLNSVPGVFFQSRYGNHDVRISIRGFGSRSNSGIRGVRILMDGIPESEPDGQTRIEAIDLNAVSDIEVVKGNSSSLYTNSPGGVVNFISNYYIPNSFATIYSDFGSFNLKRHGLSFGLKKGTTKFLTTYSNHSYEGFRTHSQDYWNILNSVLEILPDQSSKLEILGYYVDGLIKLPGSLTREQYEADPKQAAKNELTYDYKRISKKGRIGIRYNLLLDEKNNNELEVTGYGTIKYFERATNEYRIMNRYGLGGGFRYINKSNIFGKNEFSIGSDLFYQAGPVEYYQNIGGIKSFNTALTDETVTNIGLYVQENYELLKDKLNLLITARYDKVVFLQVNRLAEEQNDTIRFDDITPKLALNYKILPYVALYTSYGLSFDSPAANELDNYPLSSQPNRLWNLDLRPQKSRNFEIGLKGDVYFDDYKYFRNITFDATFFNSLIENEIVPFEVYGNVYYRNSAKTNRNGLELGFNLNTHFGLRLLAAYTFSKFKYDTYNYTIYDLQDTIQNDLSGKVVPSVPENNFFGKIAYEKRFSNFITGYLSAEYNYVSEMFANDQNSEKADAYSLINLAAGTTLSFDKTDLLISFGMNNVTDEKYVGFLNINSTKLRFYEAGAPRTYYLTTKLNFNF